MSPRRGRPRGSLPGPSLREISDASHRTLGGPHPGRGPFLASRMGIARGLPEVTKTSAERFPPILALLALVLATVLASCSPEDGRKRGERGADPGNRPTDDPVLREKTDPYRGTPLKPPRGAGS